MGLLADRLMTSALGSVRHVEKLDVEKIRIVETRARAKPSPTENYGPDS